MTENLPSPLVGLAIGDSLGMAFETQLASSLELLAWDGSYQGSAYHRLAPGQWTDDTMMAKLLAESLMNCGGFYPRDIADRYLRWFQEGPDHFRGMGKTTKIALENLNKGLRWCQSGVVGSEGNGTAMRAAPLGIFFKEDLCTVQEFARMEARITHRSHEAEMGSVAVAVGTALLARGESLPATLPHDVLEWLEPSMVRDRLQQVFELVEAQCALPDALALLGTKAHVVQTVPSAFAALALTRSYVEAVEGAIRAGGDTDTTAAIAGALAGTCYGAEGIPTKYKGPLEDFAHLRRVERKIQTGPRTNILWKM